MLGLISEYLLGLFVFTLKMLSSAVFEAYIHVKVFVFAGPQRVYKQFVLECSVHYKVDKMPYSIPPTFKPSGSRKVICCY